VFNPNGVPDPSMNNTQETELRVYSNRIQRVALHEVFTSSTCPPCNPGNVQLKKVLDAVDGTKWACIKYQYSFPGDGDPYYTSECSSRGMFYGGISGVPTLIAEGTEDMNPSSYTVPKFNALSAVPALATMRASASIHNKKVELKVTINPVANMNSANIRFFAAIVEKKTVNNVETNGETEFYYVMKKFMTNINGDVIASLSVNDSISLNNYSYTFNGNYRLPNNSRDPINHSIEHSVEDFNNLMVIYWLQDISTKEIFQTGKVNAMPIIYHVTTFANNSSMGTVTGGGNYIKDSEITISAMPKSGYRFMYWDDRNTQNPRTVTLTKDTVLTAIFAIDAPGMYHVSVFVNNSNMGTTTGSGDYPEDTTVTITAMPNLDCYFFHWQDGDTQNPRSITITQDTIYTAIFGKIYTVTVSANNPAWGSVTGEGTYNNDSIVTISATPNIGYHFLQWQDGNTDNPRIITLIQDTAFIAEFVEIFHVSVTANNTNIGTVTGEGDYPGKTTATITAIPNSGYRFVCWHDGDCQNPRIITVMQDTFFIATFVRVNAIEDLDLSFISIYPNPAFHGQFIIKHDQWTATDKAEIYTVQGLCVHICELTESVTRINISHLPTGMYFIKIKTSKGEITKKIINN
jgi:hypothetical protein